MNFYTSDIHLFHKNILKFEPISRPYKDIDEMHNDIILKWNNKVFNDDIVYIVGDVSFGKVIETVDILNSLNGNKVLIKGNHDYKLVKDENFRKCFEKIVDLYTVDGYTLCHYPMISFLNSHRGGKQLFGHLHSKWKGNTQQYNVGMDCNNMVPICKDEIEENMKKLSIFNNEILFK